MSAQGFSVSGATRACGAAPDAEDMAAALLLKEVEAFLLDGQPRHAIAHICEVTGVERDQAEAFVAELQSGVFRKSD
ncbi:hypothetical protein ACFOWX_04075 [Sphingorhabdus arenilitoris]|uniref:Uncharacterized protein n=1 Tax=Sphingorhabdus arenilitoris TaxID=1490041 RepID=A0ABV8RDV7_9SPHN